MNPSLLFLHQCSAECGFQVAGLEKVIRLGDVARAIAAHPVLGEALVLKGGTALNLCYGPPERLSVDLDYNYVLHGDREAMLADRPAIQAAVVQLAGRLGYRVQESSPGFAGTRLYLSYHSALGPTERIEIDLNFLFRVPFSGIEVRSLWQPGSLDRPEVRTVGTPELIVGKLLALLDRGAVRDVWDVNRFNESILTMMDTMTFRRLFIAFSVTLPHPLTTYTQSRLAALATPHALVTQLLPMLVPQTEVDLLRLVTNAWKRIAHLIEPDIVEREFLEAIQHGELRPELLFVEEPRHADLVAVHPAIQWKLHNIREHRTRNR